MYEICTLPYNFGFKLQKQMEIRNALQKIENYLTVVSNLNKTILSEGTMSRDELLLMKKYLYTSIDRVEDIERSLIIDKREDKSFTPTAPIENKFITQKEREIVEVAENDHIEEVEATLLGAQKEEMEDMVEEIQAELVAEEMVFVGEIKPNENKEQEEEVEKLEIAPLVESIITEDYSVNKLEEKLVEVIVEPVIEKVPVVESIITEDYSVNKLVEEKVEETIVPVSEVKSFAESIITEDYSLNKLFENKSEEQIVDSLAEPVVEKNPVVESIITEDYSINKLEETILPVQETIVAEIKPVTETLVAKLEEQNPISFAAQLESKSKEETSLFEHLEQKLNPTPQSQLFELFDDGKEELHETFANNQSSFTEPVNLLTDTKTTTSVYEQNDSVLVMEKEVETIVEQLTPSSLNDIFKPQTAVESLHSKASKTLSESIALNDKFIFVRELFGNHFGEYETGLKQLETMSSFVAAETYCKEKLWNKFNWNDKTAAVERFMSMLQKRFN
jgi:hypothetical protein